MRRKHWAALGMAALLGCSHASAQDKSGAAPIKNDGAKPQESNAKADKMAAEIPAKEADAGKLVENIEPKTLGEQIREALSGRPGSTLRLERPLDKQAPSSKPKSSRDRSERDLGKQLGRPLPKASKNEARPAQKITSTPVAPKALAAWGYGAANGPARWASLDPAYALCAAGREQAPIHIETDKTLLGPADDVEFHYPMARGWMSAPHGALEMEAAPGQAWIVARGERYELERAWLSTPSEQRINFTGSPMGVQWLHRSASGALAIVAVDVEQGAPNEALAAMLRAIPLSAQDRSGLASGADLSVLIPPVGRRKYIQYMGSLPRPPCSEGVLWIALREKVQASPEQIEAIRKLYPQIPRPVQPGNGRLVREQQ